MAEGGKNIQSVQRAIDIMRCIGDAGRDLTLREISERLELNINTARGLAQTLLDNGFLSKKVETGGYMLGYEFLTKSKLVYEAQVKHIRNLAYDDMLRIAERFGVSCWLQICFYRDIYTVETVEAPNTHYYSYTPRSGANLPLHASASGKLHIAYLPQEERARLLRSLSLERLTEHTIVDRTAFEQEIDRVFRQGYATELEECDIGICSVSAPFFDAKGALAGTLSVAAPTKVTRSILGETVIELRRAADRISAAICAKNRAWK